MSVLSAGAGSATGEAGVTLGTFSFAAGSCLSTLEQRRQCESVIQTLDLCLLAIELKLCLIVQSLRVLIDHHIGRRGGHRGDSIVFTLLLFGLNNPNTKVMIPSIANAPKIIRAAFRKCVKLSLISGKGSILPAFSPIK